MTFRLPELELVAIQVACQACGSEARFLSAASARSASRAWVEAHRMPMLWAIVLRVDGVLQRTEVRRTLSG